MAGQIGGKGWKLQASSTKCRLSLSSGAAHQGILLLWARCPGSVASGLVTASPVRTLWGDLSAGREMSKHFLIDSPHSFLPRLFLNSLWVIPFIL